MSTANSEISLARQTDCIEIAAMSKSLIEHDLPWRWKPSRILELIRHPECVVIVARDNIEPSIITGFAAMEFHELHGHLNLLAVKPEFRRASIGRHLLAWLELSAVTAGIEQIILEVRSGNGSAITFYEEAKYKIAEKLSGYYQGREDAYRMIHELISRDVAVKRP